MLTLAFSRKMVFGQMCLKRLFLTTLVLIVLTQNARSVEDAPVQTLFGTTAPLKGAFHGRVYLLPFGTLALPDFEMLRHLSDLYTYNLDIKPQNYDKYSPAIPQSEWFGIEYRASFWIKQPGEYRFFVLSDDGAKLYIDNLQVIDNDGLHQPRIRASSTRMTVGLHQMRIAYFQGEPTGAALELAVQPPGGNVRIFDLRDFPTPEILTRPRLKEREQSKP